MKERSSFRLAILRLLAALGLLVLAGVVALAQGGAAVDWWVLAGGGGPANDSGSVTLHDTLGQPIAGPSSSGDVVLGAGYWNGGSAPTAVALAWFTAAVREGAIVLAWETASEIDLLGFHLYRAEAVDGPRARLTEDLLPGHSPGSPVGASYEFVDEAVAPGVSYWYWLADVDVHGAVMLHGPVAAVVPVGASYRVYLPVVRR